MGEIKRSPPISFGESTNMADFSTAKDAAWIDELLADEVLVIQWLQRRYEARGASLSLQQIATPSHSRMSSKGSSGQQLQRSSSGNLIAESPRNLPLGPRFSGFESKERIRNPSKQSHHSNVSNGSGSRPAGFAEVRPRLIET